MTDTRKSGQHGADALKERKSDATSDETLSDLEHKQKSAASTTTSGEPGPSPDGAFDESDESKKADPM